MTSCSSQRFADACGGKEPVDPWFDGVGPPAGTIRHPHPKLDPTILKPLRRDSQLLFNLLGLRPRSGGHRTPSEDDDKCGGRSN